MFGKRGLVIGVFLILAVLLGAGVWGKGIQGTISLWIDFPVSGIVYLYNITNFSLSNLSSTSPLDTCWYILNGGSSLNFNCSTFVVGISLQPEGSYSLKVFVNDSSGQLALDNRSFGVDSLDPRVNFVEPTPNVTVINYSSFIVNITVNELNEDSVVFKLDNDIDNYHFTNVTNNHVREFAVNGLPEGNYTFTVIVNDTYWHNTTIRRSVMVDLPPVVQFIPSTKDSGAIVSQNWVYANVSVSEKYEKNITFYLENVSRSGFRSEISPGVGVREWKWEGLPDDTYYYWVCVEDYFGHRTCNGFFEYRNITLDTKAPIVTLLNPANNKPFPASQNDQIVFWSYSDDNLVVYCVVYDNGVSQPSYSIQQSSGIMNYSLNDISGKHSWYVKCTDNTAVNTGTSMTWSFTILSDLTFPVGTEYTNLSDVSDISNVANFYVKNEYGMINWSDSLDLSAGRNWADYIDISFNSVDVDGAAAELDKGAWIEIYNLTFTNPRILKDGSVCGSDCTNSSYSGGTLRFYVDYAGHVYTAEETPSGGGGGGGGGHGGGIVLWGTPITTLGTGGTKIEEETPVPEVSGERAGITGAAIGGLGTGSYMAIMGFLLAIVGTYILVTTIRGKKSLRERVKIAPDKLDMGRHPDIKRVFG